MKIEPLNNDHRLNIGIALGLRAAVNILHDQQAIYEKLPGYNTAIAVVEAIEASQRAEVAGHNFRAAARAGVDIKTNIIGMRGRGEIFAEPMDLAGLADFGAQGGVTEGGDGEAGSGPEGTSTRSAQADAPNPSTTSAEGNQTPPDISTKGAGRGQ